MLAPKGCLAAAEIAFFSPALCFGVFIVFRHGFDRKQGWLYIAILSILRIIGASATLYMYTNNDFSDSLIATAAITGSIGTAPLLLALMGFSNRINTGMSSGGLPGLVWRPLTLLSIAALVVAIVGGDALIQGENWGGSLIKAAAILFLAIYLGLVAIAIRISMNSNRVLPEERVLLRACFLALPFILIRVIYTVCASFGSQGSSFYYFDVNVYAEAFMQFLMEAITISIFVFAGVFTPKMRAPERDVEGSGIRMSRRARK